MCKHLFSIFLCLSISVITSAQTDKQENVFAPYFKQAYQANPNIPVGLLEAIASTNTRVNHIVHDADEIGSCSGLPKSYGVMGLVADGKGVFNNNLATVASLSGYSEQDIKASPLINILAFAKAFTAIQNQKNIVSKEVEKQLPVLIALTELPNSDVENSFPLNAHLYSVLSFLQQPANQLLYQFPNYQLDIKKIFGEQKYKLLSAQQVTLPIQENRNQSSTSADFGDAIWNPAASCNYATGRTVAISAVAIHDTEGSYAASISWFQNCASSVSSHYMIRSSDGQVTQMVLESNKAYHIGSENSYTIGIEHEGYCSQTGWYTTAMYNASAAVVRDICNSGYGINPLRTYSGAACTCSQSSSTCQKGGCIKVKGHQMFPSQTHADPGPNWNWDLYYKLINNNPATTNFTASSGTFYDNGGPTGNYADDERTVQVFTSTCGGQVSINFTSFNLELNWDYIYIYNGNNVNAPLLGKFTGTTLPGSFTSTNGSLCVEFRSDCATTAAGWAGTYNCNATVPVKLVYFNASTASNKRDALLTWKVTDEVNMDKYELERSFNGTDFLAFGNVKAYNSNEPQTYTYNDANILYSTEAVVYYRLKQIQKDGSFTYSSIESIKKSNVDNVIKPIGNLFSTQISISSNIQNAQKVSFNLIDVSGRICFTKQVFMSRGSSNLLLNDQAIKNLMKGYYYLQIYSTDINFTTKLLKE